MGRPPLKLDDATQATTIRLPAGIVLKIKSLVGDRGMARFIREAIERELERREADKSSD